MPLLFLYTAMENNFFNVTGPESSAPNRALQERKEQEMQYGRQAGTW